MTLAERVAEARASVKMKPAAFARAIGVSKAAMSLIDNGTTQTLKHETALAIQRVTGYRAEWVNRGTLPKKSDGAEGAAGLPPKEEMMLLLFRGLTPEQQRELVIETNAQVAGNREIQKRFLNTPLRTFSNEEVAAAYGSVPSPTAKPRKGARRRSGFTEEDPE